MADKNQIAKRQLCMKAGSGLQIMGLEHDIGRLGFGLAVTADATCGGELLDLGGALSFETGTAVEKQTGHGQR